MASDRGVTITWLGHATTLIETPAGKRILIDPFLSQNPATPEDMKNPENIDLMLITHGHFDHIADAVPIAQRDNPDVIAIFEITEYLGAKGVKNTTGMNKGGTVTWEDVEISMVNAIHSSGIADEGHVYDGGSPAGFVLRFGNDFTLYHSGDTTAFQDMRLIGKLYHPDVAMLSIGGHFTMGPREAAEAIRLLGVTSVIPIHYGTWPPLKGTPEELKSQASDVAGLKVFALKPGESITQSQLV